MHRLKTGTVVRRVMPKLILVRRYTRPDTHGKLVLPGADRRTAGYARDNSGSLWEYVAHGAEVEESLGFTFQPGTGYILQTPILGGIDAGDDLHFFIHADAVQGVHPYEEEA